VKWLQGTTEAGKDKKTGNAKLYTIKVKRKAPGPNNTSADFDQEVTIQERAAELQKKSEEIRAAYKKMTEMGKDVDVANLRSLKGEATTIRNELKKEIDDQTKTMKDALAKVLGDRVNAYAAQVENKDVAATLSAMLTPMKDGANPLAKLWDDYAAYVKDYSASLSDDKKKEIDEALEEAKSRFDRWLADQDMFNATPLPHKEVAEWRAEYAAAQAKKAAAEKDKNESAKALAQEELDSLTKKMQAELKNHSDAMRAQVGAPLLGEDHAKGYAAPENGRRLWIFPRSWSLIDYLDWSTRWFLLVVGALLMVGLFTRLSCFAAAGFLVLTILTQPSFPWLPSPPTSEGNYLFVNKNVIELIALLGLMTTRSGKWFGLDAIVCRICCRRRA
jgi:uncharacterized membrane protein YphA (DoxX/SURF4 family)